MAKGADSPSDMALARQSDGLKVIFDQKSPGSSHSRSRSRSNSSSSSCSSGSGLYRGRDRRRRRHRSSSSSSASSSSKSSSHSRSRSHPRCHRRSSRCRCDSHRRYGSGRHRRSPPRRYRSRSRSSSRWNRTRRPTSQYRSRVSRSPSRTIRSRSRSRPSRSSVSLSLQDKKQLLETAKTNAMRILGVEKLELPESVKPILPEESERLSPEPEIRVRRGPVKTVSQSDDSEPEDASSPTMSPKRRIISFSINNSVAKPTVAAPSCAKVTPRVDSYESRKPYGHWVPVKSGRSSNARKHTFTTSR